MGLPAGIRTQTTNKMKQKKKSTIKSLAIHEKDVGSTEVQIGLLSDKISN